MLFISLQKPQVPKFSADGIELRLDWFPHIHKEEIRSFCKGLALPVIFTLRKSSDGGKFQGSEEKRLDIIRELLSLKPDFIDLEWDTPVTFLKEITESYPEIKIILSYHNFTETPSDLDALLSQMENSYAYTYKIAAMAQSSTDALRMLDFVQRNQNKRISGICMGEKGLPTRILGPIFGNFIDYATDEEGLLTGPGQIPASDLHSIYHYHLLRPSTAIFGLIGNPVDRSISHLRHNGFFRDHKWDAVYIKMELNSGELAVFFSFAKKCGIKGLSVTMPLKEELFPFLDKVDPYAEKMGAVNTLHFDGGVLCGYNTDGIGALDAIEAKTEIKGKKIILIGAGGAARAIAYEAHQRGAHVLILNRTKQRAISLAEKIGCRGAGLEDFPSESYEILIHATPSELPVDPAFFIPGSLVMDIKTVPKMTPFLLEAEAKGCKLVYGYEMFERQAMEQFKIWFSPIETIDYNRLAHRS